MFNAVALLLLGVLLLLVLLGPAGARGTSRLETTS
jgi:hypothetical protein